MNTLVSENKTAFLQGGGEMGKLIRDFDWNNHPLGSPAAWPQSFKSALGIALNSRFPQLLYWDSEMYFFYNDAYRPSLGNEGKHPASLGKPAREVFGDIWHILKPIFETVRTGETTGSDDQLIPVYRNGKMENVYWTYSHSPVYDETGIVNGIFVTCADTTRTVLTIVENQRNLDMAMETGGLGSYRITLKTGTANFSPQIVQWFGLDRRVMSVDEFLSGLMAEDRAVIAEALEAAPSVTRAGKHDLVFRYQNPGTGQINYFRSVGRVIYDGGRASFISGLFQDITVQVQDHQKLEESETQMRSLVNNSPFPIAVYTGREMRITLANPAILRAWGKGQEVLGKRYAEVLPEMENQQLFEQLDRVFTTGIPFEVKNQFIELQKDQRTVPHYFDYSLTPLFNKEGDVYGVMNTGADVTEINLAHQVLDQLNAERKTAGKL